MEQKHIRENKRKKALQLVIAEPFLLPMLYNKAKPGNPHEIKGIEDSAVSILLFSQQKCDRL